MAGITTLSRKHTLTVYRTFSYRDKNNRPRNDKKIIAHQYLKTGKIVYTEYFLKLLSIQSIPIDKIIKIPFKDIPKYVDFGSLSINNKILDTNSDYIDLSIDNDNIINPNNASEELSLKKIRIHNSSNKTIYSGTISNFTSKILGVQLLLDQVANDIGLKKIIRQVFPDKWEEILTLSYFLITTNESVMYCQNWADNYSTYFTKPNMNSQIISELFKSIKYTKRTKFYDLWMALCKEDEYLALDVSSISSYSKLVNDVVFDCNRDGDGSAPSNICMLFGEKSGLPVFLSNFIGNTNDISTLKCFFDQIDFLSGNKYKIVLDKRFYSQNNISMLLKEKDKFQFLLSIPFNANIYKMIVNNCKKAFNTDYILRRNNDALIRDSFIKNFDNNPLKYYVFYNNKLLTQIRALKYKEAINLCDIANLDPKKYINSKLYNKYLIFSRDTQINNYSIMINSTKIDNDINNSCLLIIATNDLSLNYEDVIEIYRNKYVIDKSFCRIKNNLELYPLKIYDGNRLYGKLFIATICLIIISKIHSIMKNNHLYDKYTLIELIKSVENLKMITCNNKVTFAPITKECLRILEIFNVKIDFLDKT
jgi:transposase